MVVFILLLLGFICFILAAARVPSPSPRPDLTALGLAFWILTALIEALPKLHAIP